MGVIIGRTGAQVLQALLPWVSGELGDLHVGACHWPGSSVAHPVAHRHTTAWLTITGPKERSILQCALR